MKSQRAVRLAELIKNEVSAILLRDIKDPRVGFVSITDVEVSQDLKYVRIFVSILGDESSKRDTMKALDRASGFVRSELAKRIQLRYAPEISFKSDNSIERGARIFKILNDIKDNSTNSPKETEV